MRLCIRSINIYLNKIRRKSKTSYYRPKLKLFEGVIKRHGKYKKLLEKREIHVTPFPKKVKITDTKITKTFNNFFVKIGPILDRKF